MGQIFDSRHFTAVSRLADPVRMAAQVLALAPASDAEALALLRKRFPEHPLSARVAALAVLMSRQVDRGKV